MRLAKSAIGFAKSAMSVAKSAIGRRRSAADGGAVQSDGGAVRRVVRASAVVSAVVGRRVALLAGLLGGGEFVEDFQFAVAQLTGVEGDGLGFA